MSLNVKIKQKCQLSRSPMSQAQTRVSIAIFCPHNSQANEWIKLKKGVIEVIDLPSINRKQKRFRIVRRNLINFLHGGNGNEKEKFCAMGWESFACVVPLQQ
jgi:hypothetical protein